MTELIFYLFATLSVTSGAAVVLSRNSINSVLFLILTFFNTSGLFVLLGAEFLAMILSIVYVGAVAVLFLFVIMMIDVQPRAHDVWWDKKRWQLFQSSLKSSVYWIGMWAATGCAAFWALSWILNNVFHVPHLITARHFSILLSSQSVPETFQHSTIVIIYALMLISAAMASPLTNKITRLKALPTFARLFENTPVVAMAGTVFILELMWVAYHWHSHAALNDVLQDQQTQIPHNQSLEMLSHLLFKDYVLVFLLSGIVLLVAMIGAIVLTLTKKSNARRQDPKQQIQRRPKDTLKVCRVKIGEGI